MIMMLHVILINANDAFQARTAYLSGENLVEWCCYVCAVLFVLDLSGCPVKEVRVRRGLCNVDILSLV